MLENKLRELEARKERIEADLAREKNSVTGKLMSLIKQTYKATEVKLRLNVEDFFSGVHFTGVFDIITPNGRIAHDYVFRTQKVLTGRDPLQEIRKEYNTLVKEKNKELVCTNFDISYIMDARNALNQEPIVRKDLTSLFAKPSYNLWIGRSPVFLYQGERLLYLNTARKDTPLEILSTGTGVIMLDADIRCAQEFFGLKTGDLVNDRGYVLSGEQQNIAAAVFEQVMNGIEILPSPAEPSGYVARRKNSRQEEAEPRFRHWGQTYLAQLNPNEIIDGQLLGSGGSYKAYVFGDKTIVEFDQEERATFFFGTNYFHNLRVWQRREILSRSPEGFEGRKIHRQNRDAWRESVLGFLGRT